MDGSAEFGGKMVAVSVQWRLGRGIPGIGMALAMKEAGGISRLHQEVMLWRSDGGPLF